MRIEYTCKDGRKTIALWPSMACCTGLADPTLPARLRTRAVQILRCRLADSSDDHEMFLTWFMPKLNVAGIRRRRLGSSREPKKKHGGKDIRLGVWKSFSGFMPMATLHADGITAS